MRADRDNPGPRQKIKPVTYRNRGTRLAKNRTPERWENSRAKALSQDQKSKVVDFVAQLEVKVGGVWQPVIRYDCAHDFSHTFYPAFFSNPA